MFQDLQHQVCKQRVQSFTSTPNGGRARNRIFCSQLISFIGRLCTWNHPDTADRRLDYTFETFERFRNSLRLECAKEGTAAVLTVTPNITWPDVVYYNSYTHPYMGWRINIVDDFNRRFPSSASLITVTVYGTMLSILLNLLIMY